VIDDSKGMTVCSASTVEKSLSAPANKEGAKRVGEAIGKRALDKGVKVVVFDRGGFKYHGCVASLADAAREAGLEF
jgi:large subunit ribosomal protein L18